MSRARSFSSASNMRPSSARASIQTPSQFFVNHSKVTRVNPHAMNS